VLDAQAGVQYEGEDPPIPSHDDAIAIEIWNLLHNGSNGFDWAGLPFVVQLYGVDDVEALVRRLLVIKTHQPPETED
jgi:hypothetical protein